MRRHAALVGLVLYVPLFGLMLSAVQVRFNTILYLGVLFLVCASVLRVACTLRVAKFTAVWPLIVLSVGLLGIGAAHLVDGTYTLRSYLEVWSGVILGLGTVGYIYAFRLSRQPEFFDAFASIVRTAFVLQLALSLYESRFGIILAQGQGWLNEDPTIGYLSGALLQNRLVSRVFGINLAQALDLQNPLTGLLGQHNYWGTQLPFYNLVFWIQVLSRPRRAYWILLALVVVATVLNTSRFGLVAVLLTDVVLAYRYAVRRRGVVALSLVFVLLLLVVAYGPALGRSLVGYWTAANTLAGRFEQYGSLVNAFWDRSWYEILLGSGTTGVLAFLFAVFGKAISFESQLFATAFQSGLLGVALVACFLLATVVRARRLPSPSSVLLVLLATNVVLVSVVSNLVFNYAIFSLVALLYVQIAAGSGVQKRGVDEAYVPRGGQEQG